MDPRIYDAETKVICPYSSGQPYIVHTPYCFPEKDKPFFMPSNGCENLRGGDICQRCCAYVTMYLSNLDHSGIDTSDFSIV